MKKYQLRLYDQDGNIINVYKKLKSRKQGKWWLHNKVTQYYYSWEVLSYNEK